MRRQGLGRAVRAALVGLAGEYATGIGAHHLQRRQRGHAEPDPKLLGSSAHAFTPTCNLTSGGAWKRMYAVLLTTGLVRRLTLRKTTAKRNCAPEQRAHACMRVTWRVMGPWAFAHALKGQTATPLQCSACLDCLDRLGQGERSSAQDSGCLGVWAPRPPAMQARQPYLEGEQQVWRRKLQKA